MPKKKPLAVHQGLVNNPTRTALQDGELTTATGVEYRIGSEEIYKLPGRSAAFSSNAPGNTILGLKRLRYEDGSDTLAAVTGRGEIWESSAAPTQTGNGWNTAASVTGQSETAIPSFNAAVDRWLVCNGVDDNLIREPANVPETSSKYRVAGMKAAKGRTKATLNGVAGSQVLPNTNTGEWTDGDEASNIDLTTYSYAEVDGLTALVHEWTFNVNLAQSGRVLRVNHVGLGIGKVAGGIVAEVRRDENFGGIPDGSSLEGTTRATYKIEYSVDGGVEFTTLFSTRTDLAQASSVVTLDDSIDFAVTNLIVRATLSGKWGETGMRVYAVYVDTGGQTEHTILENLVYMVTERYYDSDGLIHESIPTSVSKKLTGVGYSANITLPVAAANSFATEYVIYRSIDEEGGGYPFMYEVDHTPITETTFVDDFLTSLTSVLDKKKLFEFITLLFYNGSQLDFPMNGFPPKSTMSINYQGSVVYVPVDIPRKLWYSMPTNISAANAEKVPSPYNIEFLTAENDTIISTALTNGGKGLVVYFDSYTMIVHYLPQAGDGGTFDNRVKDYVSQSRGTAGVHTTESFTPEDGSSTLAASADSLGLWVTDGIGLIRTWSKDFDWENYFLNIDLSTATLTNNPQMRRLELTYYTGSVWEDLHFFYGELKTNNQPKITGPHPAGYRCKTYAKVSGKWVGWSGDNTTVGAVWGERVGNTDASNGYDLSGNIPYQVETRDEYAFGLSDSAILTYVYPKFNERDLYSKDVTITATCNKDGRADAIVIPKEFNLLTGKKAYYQKFADRFRILVSDISTTALPALLGFEYVARQTNAEGTQGDS